MKPSLISCIVPVYNGERYLSEALNSILAQTYRPLEIIVVDDGSTDGTRDVVETYGAQVRYLPQNNAGPAAARNLGLSRAEGEFIAFLDADDMWHPEKLARQVARLNARPELDLCIAHLQNFWIPELSDEAETFRNHYLSRPVPGYGPPALLARRALFDKVGVFDPVLRLSEDTDWFLRVVEQGVVMEILPDVLVYRRWHKTNISRSSRQVLLKAVKASIDRRRGQDRIPRPLEFPVR